MVYKLTDKGYFEERKEWMRHALYLGEDNMELFGERYWEVIAQPCKNTPLSQQCVFVKHYYRLGGKCWDDDQNYIGFPDDDILDATIEYAEKEIYKALREIEDKFRLNEDE